MLVDHHCYLDAREFDEQREEVICRARRAGVGPIVTISTLVKKFDSYRAIAETHRDLYFSVGTHPHHAHEELDIPIDRLCELAHHPLCVAIGEAGLDYFYRNSTPQAQATGLRMHAAAARATGLPLVIHSRDADADTASILEQETEAGAMKAVLHCFTGGPELARRALALGHYISFSGIATFKNSEGLRAIAAEVPLDRILVETDAPYLAPEPHRGKRNEPSFVVHTAAVLARVKGLAQEEFAAATTENFFRLYSKVPRTAAGTAR